MKIYRIKGMSCSACAVKIEECLEKYGVRAKVNFVSEKLVVEDDNNVDIVDIVSKLGYELIKDNENIEGKEVNLLPIGIIAIIVLILAMFHIQNSEYVQLILSLIVIILSRDILLIGVKSIFKLTFTMYSLISLGVLISFLYSVFNLKNNLIYFDGICMTIFLSLIHISEPTRPY